MKTLITGATVVNEGMAVKADILIEDDRAMAKHPGTTTTKQ